MIDSLRSDRESNALAAGDVTQYETIVIEQQPGRLARARSELNL
jgi:hypothetical protein